MPSYYKVSLKFPMIPSGYPKYDMLRSIVCALQDDDSRWTKSYRLFAIKCPYLASSIILIYYLFSESIIIYRIHINLINGITIITILSIKI